MVQNHHRRWLGLIPACTTRLLAFIVPALPLCLGRYRFLCFLQHRIFCDDPIAGAFDAQHPLRLDLLLLASWPHARFHPCRCSPDNPACRKGCPHIWPWPWCVYSLIFTHGY